MVIPLYCREEVRPCLTDTDMALVTDIRHMAMAMDILVIHTTGEAIWTFLH